MAAGIYNLNIEQGSSWELQLAIDSTAGTDLNITDYSFDAKIAKSYYDENPITITSTIVNASTGVINLTLTSTQTNALDAAIEYIYDIDMISDINITTRLIEGRATISPGL